MKIVAITAFTLVTRSAQLAFLLLLGNLYGASSQTDIVFLLAAPFYALAAVLHSVIEATAMPALHRARAERCEPAFRRWLVLAVIATAVIASALVVIAIAAFHESASTIILLMLSLLPLFASLTTVASGVLNARQRFYQSAAGPAFALLPATLLVIALPESAFTLALALVVFEAFRWIPLQIFGLRLQRESRGQADDVALNGLKRNMFRVSLWQFLGAFLISLNPIVDILWANTLHAGAVTQTEYAMKLWSGVPLLFSGALVVAFSRWSMAEARGTFEFKQAIAAARRAFIWMLVVTPLLVIAARPAVDFLFGFGVMSDADRMGLANLVAAYLSGLAPMVAGLFLVRAFSATSRLHVLALGALVTLLVNLIGDWLFIGWWGLTGLGVATAVSYLASFIVLSRVAVRISALQPLTDPA